MSRLEINYSEKITIYKNYIKSYMVEKKKPPIS